MGTGATGSRGRALDGACNWCKRLVIGGTDTRGWALVQLVSWVGHWCIRCKELGTILTGAIGWALAGDTGSRGRALDGVTGARGW